MKASSQEAKEQKAKEDAARVEAKYAELLAEAHSTNLYEVHTTECLKKSVDGFGRPVLVFTPALAVNNVARLPKDQQQEGLHRLVLYFIAQCDSLVNRGYVVVYAHSFMSWFDRSKFSFLYNLYQVLPRKYKKNLQQLFILHGGMTMKVFFEFARMFISEKFYRKLQFLSNVEELYGVIPPTNLELPEQVMEYEQSLHAPPEQSTMRRTFTFRRNKSKLAESGSANDLRATFDQKLGCPPLVHQCVEYLERHLDVEGIFRVAGDDNLLHEAKDHLHAGGVLVFVDEGSEEKTAGDALTISDPHTVAQLLKAYFRELPASLFEQRYKDVIENTRENGQISYAWALRMREIVNDLQDENHETIAYLMRFLAKVAEREDQNRMSPEALSVVFAPNILAPPANDAMAAISDMKTCEISVRLMIEHADAVFP